MIVIGPDGTNLAFGVERRWLRLDLQNDSFLRSPVSLELRMNVDCELPGRLEALHLLMRRLGMVDGGRRPSRRDPTMPRLVEALRASDGMADGARQCDIAGALFGYARVAADWSPDGYLRSLVRRRCVLARALVSAGPKGVLARLI